MAEKRSFTKKITESDAFLEMPLTTQCLYFHLNMNTDDDGFVNNPKKIAKMIGATEDDLKLLIAKAFVLVFESGVIVIKHFRMHNTLRNDRYHPTSYQEEYQMLGMKENSAYTLLGNQMATKWQPNGNHLETEHNITKHNITKHNLTKHNKIVVDEIKRYAEANYSKDILDKAYEYLSYLEFADEQLVSDVIDALMNDLVIKKDAYIKKIINEREKKYEEENAIR